MKQKRLSGNAAILMVFVAFAIDLLQIALDLALGIGVVVNRFVDIIAITLFYLWFRSKKVSFTKTRALIFFGLAFVEMFPGLDAFPLWIIDVLAVIITVNMEDRLGINASTIINNPRTQKILKKGIIKSINLAANKNSLVRQRLEDSGWQGGDQGNTSRLDQNSKRNSNNAPLADASREAKIKAQQNRKSNANPTF